MSETSHSPGSYFRNSRSRARTRHQLEKPDKGELATFNVSKLGTNDTGSITNDSDSSKSLSASSLSNSTEKKKTRGSIFSRSNSIAMLNSTKNGVAATLASISSLDKFVIESIHYCAFFLLFSISTYGRLHQTSPAYTRQTLESLFTPIHSAFRIVPEEIALEMSIISDRTQVFSKISDLSTLWSFFTWDLPVNIAPVEFQRKHAHGITSSIQLFAGSYALGPIRITQKRVQRIETCSKVKLGPKQSCRPEISSSTLSKESFGGPNNDLFKWTPNPNEDINWLLPSPQAGLGEGGHSVYISTAPYNATEMIRKLVYLKNNNFVDDLTAAIIMEVTLYNPNTNLMATVTLLVEHTLSGEFIPNTYIRVTDIFQFDQSYEWILFVCELGLALYWVKNVRQEIIRMKVCGLRVYWSQFWNIMEMMLLCNMFIIGIATIVIAVKANQLLTVYNSMGNGHYVDWIPVVYSESVTRNMGAFSAVVVWIKVLKFVRISPRMAMLEMVLRIATKNLVYFFLFFFIVYMGFVQAFFMVFYVAVDDYSSVSSSFFTLFRAILGDIAFDQLQRENWLLGPILFFTFIILIFFVLMNLLLAILREAYYSMRQEMMEREQVLESQMEKARMALVKWRSKKRAAVTPRHVWNRMSGAMSMRMEMARQFSARSLKDSSRLDESRLNNSDTEVEDSKKFEESTRAHVPSQQENNEQKQHSSESDNAYDGQVQDIEGKIESEQVSASNSTKDCQTSRLCHDHALAISRHETAISEEHDLSYLDSQLSEDSQSVDLESNQRFTIKVEGSK